MKKIVLLGIVAILLCGCSKKEEQKEIWCELEDNVQYTKETINEKEVMVIKLDKDGNPIKCGE